MKLLLPEDCSRGGSAVTTPPLRHFHPLAAYLDRLTTSVSIRVTSSLNRRFTRVLHVGLDQKTQEILAKFRQVLPDRLATVTTSVFPFSPPFSPRGNQELDLSEHLCPWSCEGFLASDLCRLGLALGPSESPFWPSRPACACGQQRRSVCVCQRAKG